LTSATLWEQVRGLERHYAVSLLRKQGRQVKPTKTALRLVELVQPILVGVDSIPDVLLHESGAVPESLTIVAQPRMLIEEIIGALACFRKTYPKIRLDVLLPGTKGPEEMVLSGAADFAMDIEPAPRDRRFPGIVYETAYEIEFLLIAPRKHPLLTKKRLALADLVEYPLVVACAGHADRRRIVEVFHQHDLEDRMKISMETSSGALSLSGVREGLGIGIIAGNPDGILLRGLGLGVRPLRKWFGSVRLAFIWKDGAHQSPVQAKLAELIRDTLVPHPT
jgi:LysR family cys regulon transcriptional activator